MTDLSIASLPASVNGAAQKRFDELDWPTPRDEEWRRTDITQFPFDTFEPYQPEANNTGETTIGGESDLLLLEEIFAARLRFGGGSLLGYDTNEQFVASGVEISVLTEEGSEIQADVESLLLQTIQHAENRLETLRFTGKVHGVVIRIPDGANLESPILVDMREFGNQIRSNPHIVIEVGEGASATVIRSLRSTDDTLLCNPSDVITVGDNGKLQMVTVDDLGTGTNLFEYATVTLGNDSRLIHTSSHLGGALVKSRLSVELSGAGSEALLNGVYFATGNQHMDIKTVQNHLSENAQSRSLYKGAVRDSGRTVFQGLIDVGENASKTDAYLTNKNLVLNDGARADSIPSLKIKTNDVKCSHGSTTGRIDKEHIFYLMSRGFSRPEASRILMEGYFEDALKSLSTDVRDFVMAGIIRRIDAKAIEA